ncbi:hypothetical protein [Peribacillus sp. Hz7]|uniref:hypothetical protein n=1 Tax=Peribacillus sp. Hz7 TaxID=3344873 RepID=UPI0035CA374A
MNLKWSIWILKLIWIVGLVGLILTGYHFEQYTQQNTNKTFNVLPLYWFYSIVPFLFGAYISLLFVKKWSFKINKPLLLCVTAPCFIISFYLPTVSTFFANATFLPNAFWVFELNSFGIVSMVAGLTLIVGLFNNVG